MWIGAYQWELCQECKATPVAIWWAFTSWKIAYAWKEPCFEVYSFGICWSSWVWNTLWWGWWLVCGSLHCVCLCNMIRGVGIYCFLLVDKGCIVGKYIVGYIYFLYPLFGKFIIVVVASRVCMCSYFSKWWCYGMRFWCHYNFVWWEAIPYGFGWMGGV